jgi:hypothetical protein
VRFRGGGVIQLDPHAGGGLFGIDLARQASRPPVATAKAFNGALHECMRQTLASVATSQPLRLLNGERRRADMCSLGESLTPSLQSADQ